MWRSCGIDIPQKQHVGQVTVNTHNMFGLGIRAGPPEAASVGGPDGTQVRLHAV